MKASLLINTVQKLIDRDGDLDIEIVKSEGGLTSSSKPIISIGSDGESAIYIQYSMIKCPVCKKVWGVANDDKQKTLRICEPCHEEFYDKIV